MVVIGCKTHFIVIDEGTAKCVNNRCRNGLVLFNGICVALHSEEPCKDYKNFFGRDAFLEISQNLIVIESVVWAVSVIM
jgi:hypothetical protein